MAVLYSSAVYFSTPEMYWVISSMYLLLVTSSVELLMLYPPFAVLSFDQAVNMGCNYKLIYFWKEREAVSKDETAMENIVSLSICSNSVRENTSTLFKQF